MKIEIKTTVLSFVMLLFCLCGKAGENIDKEYKLISKGQFILAINKDIEKSQGIASLLSDIDRVEALIGSNNAVLKKLKKDTIWIENGHNVTKRIVISDVSKFIESTKTNQPDLLINYLAKAYFNYHAKSDLKNKLSNIYNSSRSKYEKVYHSNGVKLDKEKSSADAYKSAEDYFAELSEAYWGVNDYYPFDYKDLERFDPAGFKIMEEIWGKRKIAINPYGITLPPESMTQSLRFEESPMDLYYAKYLDADGLALVSSRFVSDEALVQARSIINTMLKKAQDSKQEMIKNKFRIGIIGAYENVSDMPECRMMSVWWPGTDWDARGRGYGATPMLPLMTCGEENIIKIPNYRERYANESIMVHEFAHNVDYGLRKGRDGFSERLAECFKHAKDNDLWTGTYSMSNDAEYFAEGAQAWFDTCNMHVKINGERKRIKTREDLKNYDPILYDLMSDIFPEDKLEGYHFTYE